MASAPRAYRVVGVVGHGGFGTVYRAELVGPGGFVRRVALKVLNPEVEADAELGQRLRDEARMLGLVRHRAIVYVDELTLLDGRWTVVMELVEGADLRKLLDEGPMPASAALEVVAEVASALSVAHSATGPDGLPLVLLHRDLKPSNLLLTPHGDVKIVDFGVARGQFAGREAATREFAFGSPGYMPPERTELVECPEGDIYSLGVVLYELVTGQRFGRAHLNRRKHVRHVQEVLLSAQHDGVPEVVCELIRKMVSFEVLSRPDAKEVERQARQLRSTVEGPWLRDWAPGALASLPAEEEVEERKGRSEATAEIPEEEVLAATFRVETMWEARDVDHTLAARRSPPPTPPVASVFSVPSLPPRPKSPSPTPAMPRLPPARTPSPAPLAPMPQARNPWPVSWSELPTVMMEEPARAREGLSWLARAGWAAVALAPVPVIGVVLGASAVLLWFYWNS